MEELSKDDLINKWKTERNKLLSELSFCSEHKFNLEAELIRHKIELLGSFILYVPDFILFKFASIVSYISFESPYN